MGRQPFVAGLRDVVMILSGFRCGINMDRSIGEVLQVVKNPRILFLIVFSQPFHQVSCLDDPGKEDKHGRDPDKYAAINRR